MPRVRLYLLSTVCWLGVAGGLGAQPTHDVCTGALEIGEGFSSFSTLGATNDARSHPTCKADPETYHDIWFRHVANCTGNLTVSTCGFAEFNTDLVLYNGCDCDSLVSDFQTCNDDQAGCFGLTSELTLPVTEGSCFLIRVGGSGPGDLGNGSLSINCLASDAAACCLPGENCIITTPEDCQGQGGEFNATVFDCESDTCAIPLNGPDVIYSGCDAVASFGTADGIRAYSLQSQTCNIGDNVLQWNSNGPLLAMNAYRLQDGRLRQIGMSWVTNATIAIAGSGCEPPCNNVGGAVLGPGCRDVYSAGYNGTQGILGPRSAVNAFTGAYPGPSGGGGDQIYKRLQIPESELDPGDGSYFIEGQYVAPDDAAAGNAMNNASYRRVALAHSLSMTPEGPMFETVPAIFAWRDHGLGVNTPDPSVEIVTIDVPQEGRFHLATKVTDLGTGAWLYDYAVHNFNSHRSAGSFRVPFPPGTQLMGVGFSDVDYHSGEPFDATDWTVALSANGIDWSSPETFAENPDTNALRFATMYNFWFEADQPPGPGAVTLGLFRPDATGPSSVTTSAPVPTSAIGTPAGAVPDMNVVPGQPLTVSRDGANLDLAWGKSCVNADADYAILEGALGDFSSHGPLVCGTGEVTFATILPGAGDRYYLIAPLSADREGSYGTDSAGVERPQGTSACGLQQVAACR